MDGLLVEFCRSGTLGPLELGMSPDDVVRRVGMPDRSKDLHGDSCFRQDRHGQLELLMRCFSRAAEPHRRPARDLVLASVSLDVGRGSLALPEAISGVPIEGVALRLTDARELLADHGVETKHTHESVLERAISGAVVRVTADRHGLVAQLTASWRPSPGGWLYSEEDPAGSRVGYP